MREATSSARYVVLSEAKDLIAAGHRHEILRFAQDDKRRLKTPAVSGPASIAEQADGRRGWPTIAPAPRGRPGSRRGRARRNTCASAPPPGRPTRWRARAA